MQVKNKTGHQLPDVNFSDQQNKKRKFVIKLRAKMLTDHDYIVAVAQMAEETTGPETMDEEIWEEC